MGKVKDGTQAAKATKPSGGGGKGAKNQFVSFLVNLVKTDLYKPMQGKQARLWTGVGLGVVVAAGLYRLVDTLTDYRLPTRYGVPAIIGAVLGWIIFRLVQFPPFVEFLIATEAEMNKVSWTSRAELYRATVVVLTTVLVVAVYLFGVDWLWSYLLQAIGVLRFSGDGAFGSQAG
ncbi:MAG TPA: preprotein translocase subunit SecE [Isosphaeraceae bacterium]|nr:preprotein translocase subunit SecE [Isosphaeraceae bacterium]